MYIANALRYPFRDKGWLGKLAAGAFLYIVPILGWVMWHGYLIEIIRRVSAGYEDELPAWSDFGDYGKEGLFAFAAFILYFLPGLLLFLCAGLATGGAAFQTNSQAGASALGITGVIAIVVYIIVAQVLYIPGLLRFATTGEFKSFFLLPQTISVLLQHTGVVVPAFLQVILGHAAIVTLAQLLFFTICIPILAFPYAFMFDAYTLGRLARNLGLIYEETHGPVAASFWT